jgi:hypothetical protein
MTFSVGWLSQSVLLRGRTRTALMSRPLACYNLLRQGGLNGGEAPSTGWVWYYGDAGVSGPERERGGGSPAPRSVANR